MQCPTPPATPVNLMTLMNLLNDQEPMRGTLLEPMRGSSPTPMNTVDWNWDEENRDATGLLQSQEETMIGRTNSQMESVGSTVSLSEDEREDMNIGSSSFVSARRLLWPESRRSSPEPDIMSSQEARVPLRIAGRMRRESRDRLNLEVGQLTELVQQIGTGSGTQQDPVILDP